MISLCISNLPLLNQRMEYDQYKQLLASPEFRKQLEDKSTNNFDCGKFVWVGKEEGASVLLQRLTLGLEARIPIAVSLELACQGRLNRELVEMLNDPFSLQGRGTADCYYNRVPALIGVQHALCEANPDLWELVRTFYRDIRNKLFHGGYVTNLTAEKLDYIFSVFDQVYAWCDSWCNVVERINEIGSGKHGRPVIKKEEFK